MSFRRDAISFYKSALRVTRNWKVDAADKCNTKAEQQFLKSALKEEMKTMKSLSSDQERYERLMKVSNWLDTCVHYQIPYSRPYHFQSGVSMKQVRSKVQWLSEMLKRNLIRNEMIRNVTTFLKIYCTYVIVFCYTECLLPWLPNRLPELNFERSLQTNNLFGLLVIKISLIIILQQWEPVLFGLIKSKTEMALVFGKCWRAERTSGESGESVNWIFSVAFTIWNSAQTATF